MIGKCILLGTLFLLARADLRTKELPIFWLILSSLSGAGIYLWKQPFSLWSLAGGVAVGGFLILCSAISREGIGRGDGYLFCVTGIFLGFQENMALLLTSVLLCSAGAVILLAVKRCGRRSQIPFIPFVLAADVLLMCR